MTDRTVVVALDGSESDLRALPIAARFAELVKGSVRRLGASEEASPPGGGAQAILAAAEESGAALIVMSEAAGDAARAVLQGAHCPVVLVGSTGAAGEWTLRKVLAPHDGSPTVSGALRPASEIAREAGAELIVLQVAGGERALEPGSIAPPQYLDQLHHSWPAWSREFLHRLAGACPLADVRVRLLVGHGAPADETVRVASEESADLIVLAWRGRHDGASTVKAVLRDAPCPVMVTRVAAA